MFTLIMKWFSIVSLTLAVFLRSSPNFQLFLQGAICVAALLVFIQALRTHKYGWATGFLVITVLFNPVAPVSLPGRFYFLLDLACLGAFLASVVAVRPTPIPSIPSITGRRTGSESL
jgi:Family of unknown function (DUF6804)